MDSQHDQMKLNDDEETISLDEIVCSVRVVLCM